LVVAGLVLRSDGCGAEQGGAGWRADDAMELGRGVDWQLRRRCGDALGWELGGRRLVRARGGVGGFVALFAAGAGEANRCVREPGAGGGGGARARC
jgi:hypothetical protein